MNKEEKEAIENLEHIVEHWKPDENDELANIEYNSIKVAVNLIDKLQKQLDQLKEVDRQICCEELITKDKYQDILKENEELKEDNRKLNDLLMLSELDYVSKDIIRNKIKELEKDIETHSIYEENWNKIEVLKELLGE